MSQFIAVKVTPRSKHNKILGWRDDILRVHLVAPPVDGKANSALIKFLSNEWEVSKSSIKIIKGKTSRDKVLEVATGVPKKQLQLNY